MPESNSKCTNPSGDFSEIAVEPTPTRPPFKARVEAAQNLLRERYPDLFGNDPKPLKIGIHLELLERHPDLDFVGLKRALTLHCGRFAYQKALTKPGAARLDLEGQPDGEVTAEQAEIARQRLAELKAALKAKKATKSPAPATPAPTPVPTPPPPPEPPAAAVPGRPVLRLKPKTSAVVTVATVTRRAKS
jgi:sRNA-binding protein